MKGNTRTESGNHWCTQRVAFDAPFVNIGTISSASITHPATLPYITNSSPSRLSSAAESHRLSVSVVLSQGQREGRGGTGALASSGRLLSSLLRPLRSASFSCGRENQLYTRLRQACPVITSCLGVLSFCFHVIHPFLSLLGLFVSNVLNHPSSSPH